MNGLSGLAQSRKAWYVSAVIGAGQALVQTGSLSAVAWWYGSCALAGLYVVAHAVQEHGNPARAAAKVEPKPEPPASGG